MISIRAVDGDRLDLICWKHYGTLDGRVVEQVLEANKGLEMATLLASGVKIILPEIISAPLEESLW